MSVITGEDIEVIEVLDFEYDEPCDFGRDTDYECEQPVEWRIILNCCAATFLFCDEHFWHTVTMINDPTITSVCPRDRGGCGKHDVGIAHAEKIDKKIGSN